MPYFQGIATVRARRELTTSGMPIQFLVCLVMKVLDQRVIQSERLRCFFKNQFNLFVVVVVCWVLGKGQFLPGQSTPGQLLTVPTIDSTEESHFDPNQTLNWPDSSSPLEYENCELNEGMNSPRTIIKEKHWFLQQMNLRSSASHGRAMGPGRPLRGTSWLNRPYEVTFESGALIMLQRPAANVRKSNDYYAAMQLGWDFDHYWGSQVRLGWSTPELLNTTQVAESSSDNLFITDVSFLYYPWGDSRVRPYYRAGLGLTNLEYTNDQTARISETLLTFPLGVGLKYQFRRWAAFRLEIMNNLAIGMNETSSLNNMTVTGGFEWRFGGRPASYWAWAGRGGAW